MKKPLKILIVDDSAFMRLLLSDILDEDSELEVVGVAVDGKDAVEKSLLLKPDVMVLDMNMGEYSGLYAVKHVMSANPLPILILSSVGNTNLNPIFDALELGAVDYINKPITGGSKIRQMHYELIRAVKSVASAKPRATNINSNGLNRLPHTFDKTSKFHVIVIGASTGGPTAIEKVITSLPANLTVPVLICQHMPANFITSFAKRLDSLSSLNVVVGRKGMKPQAGMIIIAPGNSNMIVQRSKTKEVVIGFSEEKYKEYNNPSINALMLSVAACYENKAICTLLTGMGKDGVHGVIAIKKKGGLTIAQDEASSIIFGMPKMAIESGAVDQVLPIKEIGAYLVNCL